MFKKYPAYLVDAVRTGDEAAANCWAPNGACRAAGHALIGGATGGAGGAAGAAISRMAAPYVLDFLQSNGVSPAAAKAITELSAIGAGAVVGGGYGAAAGFNESANNAVLATPLIIEGIVEGGAIAARMCLSSPSCLNALRLGGTAAIAKVASLVDPADLAKIPGFASSSPLPPVLPLYSPAQVQKQLGTPPLNSPDDLKQWLGNALDGYPADEANQWAKDFINTLPAAQQQTMGDLIMQAVQDNAVAGSRREREVTSDLQAQFPSGSVQNQHYLRDKNGNIVIDPNTGTARRLDHIVIVNGQVVDTVETTSLTAPKERQLTHELEIRAEGGIYIRDRDTGKLVQVPSVSRVARKP